MLEIKRISVTKFNEELENVCYTLYTYKKQNIDAYFNFNGIIIKSKDIIDIDSIEETFHKVYGCSYSEYVKRKAKELRPIWLEEGYKLIAPEKHEKWRQFVDETIEIIDLFHIGNPITDILIIIKEINETDNIQALKEYIISKSESDSVQIKTAIELSNKDKLIKRKNQEEQKLK